MLLPDSFAEGDYGFEITKEPEDVYHTIYDLYINGAMIGNNVNERGVGRAMTKGGDEFTYKVRSITAQGGSIELEKEDFYSLSQIKANGWSTDGLTQRVAAADKAVSKIVVKKEATVANRNKKVYILGDSLVAIYYGEPISYDTTGLVGTARTGWGQVIHNFINDDVDVLDLANSGQWAAGLKETAFTCVMQSAREGDYMILESGWNDVSYSSRSEMKQAVIDMVEACEAKGIIPILVTPNSSAYTYSAAYNTQYASTMREAASEMKAKYDDVILVDLAKLSYDFIKEQYNGDVDEIDKNVNLGNPPSGYFATPGERTDTLHLSYMGAMKYAELVAQSMSDQGIDFINKEFQWSIVDRAGNTISVQVK